MAAPVTLDLSLLRGSATADVAAYFLDQLKTTTDGQICEALLAEVDRESLPPNIFSTFLSSSKSAKSIVWCLRQDVSHTTRAIAIAALGTALRNDETWQEAWTTMGNTEGVIAYLSTASVREVNDLISTIAKSNQDPLKASEKATAVEELFKVFLPLQVLAGERSNIKNPDPRPLQNLYPYLILGCSSQFAGQWLMRSDTATRDHVGFRQFFRYHGVTMCQQIDYAMRDDTPIGDAWLVKTFSAHTSSYPPLPGVERKFSASMEYSEKILRWRLVNPSSKAWPNTISETSVYASFAKRCIKKRVKKERLKEVISMGFQVYRGFPDGRRDPIWNKLWQFISGKWQAQGVEWEPFLTEALQTVAGVTTTKDIIPAFLRFPDLAKMDKTRRWHLFRLYHFHSGKKPIDVDIDEHIQRLGKIKWPKELFELFETGQTIRLLKTLIQGNLDYDFLQPGYGKSILHMPKFAGRVNFDALLYLRHLQQYSTEEAEREEARRETAAAVADLRNRSIASREQENRAVFAKAACFMAIASGDLDLYASTVEGLERYIRDPLSAKTLFSSHAIETVEGIQLLAGIPRETEPELGLADISKRVTTADGILRTFHNHFRLARRQPSFQKRDWTALPSLFGEAIDARVTNASLHRSSLRVTDGDMFSAVWSQSLATLAEVGYDSLSKAEYRIQRLIDSLSASSLVEITQALLKMSDAYRVDKAKDGDAEDKSAIVDRLAYNALIALSKSDKPKLAKKLIIQTIIDRPDASAWHRQFLTLGYMKSLPAKDAESLLLDFANEVGEKLQEQSYVRIEETTQTKSIIKISTVKYLAQILQNAEFVSADAAVEVLLELFKSGTHIDVRISTFGSLMSFLIQRKNDHDLQFDKTLKASDQLAERILVALQEIVPDIAGSINERRPPLEVDWKEAEDDPLKLPAIYPSLLDNPPLLENVIQYTQGNLKPKSTLCDVFVKRILLPTVQRSTVDHDRWVKLFLRKYEATFTADELELPAVAITPGFVTSILINHPHLLPDTELQQLEEYYAFFLHMPSDLAAFNKRLKQKVDVRDRPEVQHWLAVFDRKPAATQSHFITHLISQLRLSSSLDQLVTGSSNMSLASRYQEIIETHLRGLLPIYDRHVREWDELVREMHPPTRGSSRSEFTKWLELILPLLIHSADAIDSRRRSPKWQYDANRTPAILPHTTQIRLWAAACPSLAVVSGTEQKEEALTPQSKLLASQLLAFTKAYLAECSSTTELTRLTSAISSFSNLMGPLEQVLVGCLLGEDVAIKGDGREKSEAGAVFLVTAAQECIGKGRKAVEADSALAERIRTLPMQWRLSQFEGVREIAFSIRSKSDKLWV